MAQQNKLNARKNRSLHLLMLLLLFFAAPAWAVPTTGTAMQSIHYLSIIVQDFCIVAGLSLFLAGLFKMKRYGEMRTMMSHHITISQPLGKMIAGVVLLCLPLFVGTISLGLWGQVSPLAYPILSNSQATEMFTPIIAMIRLMGVLGIIRGVFLFSRSGGQQAQPGMVGKGVMHILGGLLCLHILNTVDVLRQIFNFSGN